MSCLPFCHLTHFDTSKILAAYHLLLLLQERQSDSCESMSEATSQSSTSCDSPAMGTDSSSPSSPDSHLHKSQREYTSASAEMSPIRHECEEAASMPDAACSSSTAASDGFASNSQVCASDACFVQASLVP